MAKPKRKAPKSKPVTQHQLFPAVIALWFGALFGLGSLAVRPSLLEELVIKSRIDLVIPAAAPPLGMTARMAVALALAALGAMIGAAIARRIARPKPEVRERKRTTLSTRDEGAGSSVFQGYADASTRNPGLTSADAAAPGALAGRRRSLAIEHEVDDFVPHDMAPLPGGAPQIFDIAASGLSDVPAELVAPAAPGHFAEPVPAVYTAPAQVALDWANAAPVLPPVAAMAPAPVPQAIAAQRQVFEPAAPVPELEHDHFASEDGRQVFGMAQPATPPAELPRQIFGAPVTDDHVPKEFVEAQGFRTSVFETPESNPLFAARADAAPSELAPAEAFAPAAIPQAYAPPVEAAVPAPAEEAVVAAPAVQPEPEPALPSPASLGIEDLSARLAESMRRRRAGRTDSAAEAVEEPAPQPAQAQPEATEPAVFAPVPQAFESAAAASQVLPEAQAAVVPAFSVPPFVVPPFTVPAAEQRAEPVAAEPIVAAIQAPQAIPAALRPLDLTGFEEDDNAQHESLLPPRRIAFPAAEHAPPAGFEPAPIPAPAFAAVPAMPAAFAPLAPVEDEPEIAEEAAVAEENYASLLGVTPPPASLRNPFVRVEESAVDRDTVEPVVIFPGQAVPPPQPFTVAVAAGDDSALFRRFDAPASAGQGQPSAANEGVHAMPSEEAERALRSALANLQRMRGAA